MNLPTPIDFSPIASFEVLTFLVADTGVTCDVVVRDGNGVDIESFSITASPSQLDCLRYGLPSLEKLQYPNTTALAALIEALASATSIPDALAASAQVLFDEGLFQANPPETQE